jgi:hypothetical protein
VALEGMKTARSSEMRICDYLATLVVTATVLAQPACSSDPSSDPVRPSVDCDASADCEEADSIRNEIVAKAKEVFVANGPCARNDARELDPRFATLCAKFDEVQAACCAQCTERCM